MTHEETEGNKWSMITCKTLDIDTKPVARFFAPESPLWVVNANTVVNEMIGDLKRLHKCGRRKMGRLWCACTVRKSERTSTAAIYLLHRPTMVVPSAHPWAWNKKVITAPCSCLSGVRMKFFSFVPVSALSNLVP